MGSLYYFFADKWYGKNESGSYANLYNDIIYFYSEEFNSGFGSKTPMILGLAKVVRYFPNYERYLIAFSNFSGIDLSLTLHVQVKAYLLSVAGRLMLQSLS